MSDRQALFVGDILATGYWAAKISEIFEEDTVLIIGIIDRFMHAGMCAAVSAT